MCIRDSFKLKPQLPQVAAVSVFWAPQFGQYKPHLRQTCAPERAPRAYPQRRGSHKLYASSTGNDPLKVGEGATSVRPQVMPFALTPEREREFADILTRYPNKMAATIPVLHLCQEQNGWISDDLSLIHI